MVRKSKPANIGEPVITDELRKVAELTPDPNNARRHSEAQISQLVTSIERFGYIEKLVIRPNGQVIGGHARVEALKRLGH
jgi:ParB-like chromosome segregation protein Spo0J